MIRVERDVGSAVGICGDLIQISVCAWEELCDWLEKAGNE
jgi:hypothetical protein